MLQQVSGMVVKITCAWKVDGQSSEASMQSSEEGFLARKQFRGGKAPVKAQHHLCHNLQPVDHLMEQSKSSCFALSSMAGVGLSSGVITQ